MKILMNGKELAIKEIENFLRSNEKGLLITGTHQYEKHRLVMKIINKCYKNAHILFRINSMDNITDDAFIGLHKKPRAGEKIKIGNNYYEFDSFNTKSTWSRTCNDLDFAILYPIDALCRSMKKEAIEDLYNDKKIGKILLCSWTDNLNYDFSKFSEFYSKRVIYDAEEEDFDYHQRVLKNINMKDGN